MTQVWAAVWLNKATKNLNYLKEAEEGYKKLNEQNNAFYWDEKIRGITVCFFLFGFKFKV